MDFRNPNSKFEVKIMVLRCQILILEKFFMKFLFNLEVVAGAQVPDAILVAVRGRVHSCSADLVAASHDADLDQDAGHKKVAVAAEGEEKDLGHNC